MISLAKTGSQVLQVDGLSTASLVNPEREGQLWAESQSAALKMTAPEEPVVVLGVASGFHLQALVSKLKARSWKGRLIAVDTCEPSIEFSKWRVLEASYIRAQPELGVDRFLTSEEVASWILQPFTLLRHKPTMSRTGAALRVVESWILGRTPESFSAQLKLRPQIAAGLNPDRARRIAEVSLVSVRDLSKAWDISSELKNDRRIFRILEELVR